MSGDVDRVYRILWNGAMPSLAGDSDPEAVGGSQGRPLPPHHSSNMVDPWKDVKRQSRVYLGILENPRFYHGCCTLETLFSGLEHEFYLSGQLRFMAF